MRQVMRQWMQRMVSMDVKHGVGRWAAAFSIGALALASPVLAEDSLEQKVKRLEEDVRALKAERAQDAPVEEGMGGRLSFHGYGELHYNYPKTGATVPKEADAAEMDFHRMVWGLSYQVSDRISLHTEVDFEHAAKEIELEFAYLDFLIAPAFNLRAGSMLMPVGPLNEFHEPPLFYSVERPYVQANIIPTTWMEGGVGAFGTVGEGFKYRLYVVSGLDASKFTDTTGIRGGRGKVGSAPAEDLAAVGRLEYSGRPGLEIGGSLYWGGANTTKNPALSDAGLSLWEMDLRLRKAGLDLRAVGAYLNLVDADKMSAVAKKNIGKEMQGWYLEAAYNLLRVMVPASEHALVGFARYETFNTQKEMPSGFTASPKNDRQVVTAGLAYYPHQDIAIKADIENWKDGTNDTRNRFNLGLAYQF